MSGEHLRDDDDFLDDDFVLEDDGVVGDVPQEELPPPTAAVPSLAEGRRPVPPAAAGAEAAAEEDLDALFEPLPVETAASIVELDTEFATGSGDDPADELFAIAEPDAFALADEGAPEPAAVEDVLFASPAVQPEPIFEAPPTFDATGRAEWSADDLHLDEPAARESLEDPTVEMLHGDASRVPLTPEAVEAVTREFERELESLDAVIAETGDEDLVVDSEQDLEIVDAPATELVEAEQSYDELPALELLEQQPLEPWEDADELAAQSVAEGEDDPAWSPLDVAAQELEEEPTENPYAEEYYAQEHELADRQSEELYVEEEPVAELAPVIGGPRPARRLLPILMSVAASLAILTSGAVVVTRPEWFGLSFGPERMPTAQVERPTVAPAVTAPALPPLPVAVTESQVSPGAPVVAAQPGQTAESPSGASTSSSPAAIAQAEGDESAKVVPVEPAPVSPQPVAVVVPIESSPKVAGEAPVAVAPEVAPTAAVVEPAPELNVVALPVPIAQKSHSAEAGRDSLVRVSDQLLIGGSLELPPAKPSLPDGLTLGSRAFAQLRNGNYFVGSVKRIEEASLTLVVAEGEVSLPNDSIVRLTKLGAGDFEALMKVTEGSVRLTNNNKLVGSIIRDIADDHVVLEFRSNRVILPRSAVDDIVEGAAAGGVRLGTTAQEESWLREIAERELGSGLSPTDVAKPPAPAGAGSSPQPTPIAPTPIAPAPVPPLPKPKR